MTKWMHFKAYNFLKARTKERYMVMAFFKSINFLITKKSQEEFIVTFEDLDLEDVIDEN